MQRGGVLRRSWSDIFLNVDGGIPRFNLGGTGGNGPPVSGVEVVLLKPGSQWAFFDSVNVSVSVLDAVEDESSATITSGS